LIVFVLFTSWLTYSEWAEEEVPILRRQLVEPFRGLPEIRNGEDVSNIIAVISHGWRVGSKKTDTSEQYRAHCAMLNIVRLCERGEVDGGMALPRDTRRHV
jgi:hypothetical protein